MRRIGTGLIALSMALTGVITGQVGTAHAASMWYTSRRIKAEVGGMITTIARSNFRAPHCNISARTN